MRSMTGFGVGHAVRDGVAFRVEIRTVNHRFFEARIKTEGVCPNVAEERLRKRLDRGRADVLVRREGGGLGIDPRVLEGVVGELVRIRDAYAPGEPLPWAFASELLRARGERPREDESAAAVLDEALDQALVALDAARLAEGAKLREELERLLHDLAATQNAIAQAVPRVVEKQRERVTRRFRELAEGVGADLPKERVEFEIAALAERMDVREELARLDAHVAAFRGHLAAEAPVGRTLDFLVQEMLREVNTTGSKVADADVAQRVVAAKTSLERLREQVQNVL